jgi:Spy/CpxP family protein refolding chaperone
MDSRHSRSPVLRVLACVTLCLSVSVSAEPQSMRYKWWLSADIQKQLHLTSEQVRKIDEIYDATLPARRARRRELDALDRQLDALLVRGAAEDTDAEALITRVEDAHARRNVARTMMLYKMRKVLTVEQRRWFDSRSQTYGR